MKRRRNCHLPFEGGLSTSFRGLKANIWLSMIVAVTGIALPIAFSFVLQRAANATALQSFAAGAALCSTSLGTTFTVLNTSGLSETRLGVVLSSAAMMDDVVGLVMVQVISNLGASAKSFNAVTVIRPIFVSLAFVIMLLILCRWVLKPMTIYLNTRRQACQAGFLNRTLERKQMALILHTTFLLSMVAGASYAGTTNLFTAYLAGAAIGWWDTQMPHQSRCGEDSTTSRDNSTQKSREEGSESLGAGSHDKPTTTSAAVQQPIGAADKLMLSSALNDTSGLATYHRYYHEGVERILKPFFFASIGFSIPISRMFTGAIVWRGIVYSLLMALAKMACGIWLVRLQMPGISRRRIKIPLFLRNLSLNHFWGRKNERNRSSRASEGTVPAPSIEVSQHQPSDISSPSQASSSSPAVEPLQESSNAASIVAQKPTSLYPPAIISIAMVARGEIGFLISSLAESNGIFSSQSPTEAPNDAAESEIFLIVTWAIVLCTILGPICVGLLVKRVKRLEKGKGSREQSREDMKDVLGVWGVE